MFQLEIANDQLELELDKK